MAAEEVENSEGFSSVLLSCVLGLEVGVSGL